MINLLLPETIKEGIKTRIKAKLNLVPVRTLDISNRVIKVGISNYLTLSYENMKGDTLNYTNSLNTSDYAFKFAQSRDQPTLYASVYACMLKGMYGELDLMTKTGKRKWADYFDSFQTEDGYFRDPALAGEEFESDVHWGDGWGIRHLAGHIIIAYARLGYTPNYKFGFLEQYYTADYIEKWLDELFATKNMWTASNYIMNIITLMQYSRDYMYDTKADGAIQFTLDWLEKKQNPATGLWHNELLKTEKDLHAAIRGAYHYFPLFIYENREINYKERIIDNILKSQNSWGGFDEELHPSGACEDIDALDPLIRFTLQTNYRKDEVDVAVKRALYWVMANLNDDGGFTFMPVTPHEYGGHPLTSSLKGESNLMATWFRTLCLAYMMKYLNIDNNFDIQRIPGYELPLQ